MSQIEVFNNEEFGSIRVIEENGKYFLCGLSVFRHPDRREQFWLHRVLVQGQGAEGAAGKSGDHQQDFLRAD